MGKKIRCFIFALFLLVPFLAVAGGQKESKSASSTSGLKYQGVNLTMLIQGGAAYDIPNASGQTYLQMIAQKFKAETGATVKIVGAPWEQLMPKIMTDVQSGANEFDAGLYDIEFQYTIYPYLLNIQPMITKSGYDMKGFVNPIYTYGNWAGKDVRYGLPMTADAPPVIYRTDLVKSIPTTWSAFDQMLKNLKASGKVKYPVTLPGVSAQLVKMFLVYFWSTGDKLLTPDWKPLINDKNGVWAIQQLNNLIKNYAAPGTPGFDNPDAANQFIHGDAAIYANWLAFILPSLNNDKDNALVKGKWALGRFPAGGTGNFTEHNMIIMKSSKHPQAMFDYIAMATSKENMVKAVLDYGIDVSRASVLTDPAVLAKYPWEKSYAQILDAAKPFTPGVPYWLQMFVDLADGLSKYISGQSTDPQATLNAVAAKWSALIKAHPLNFSYHG